MRLYLADGRRAYEAGGGIYLTEAPRSGRDILRTALICGAVTAAATAALLIWKDRKRKPVLIEEE